MPSLRRPNSFFKIRFPDVVFQDTAPPASRPDHAGWECLLRSFSSTEQDRARGTLTAAQSPKSPFRRGIGKAHAVSTELISSLSLVERQGRTHSLTPNWQQLPPKGSPCPLVALSPPHWLARATGLLGPGGAEGSQIRWDTAAWLCYLVPRCPSPDFPPCDLCSEKKPQAVLPSPPLPPPPIYPWVPMKDFLLSKPQV